MEIWVTAETIAWSSAAVGQDARLCQISSNLHSKFYYFASTTESVLTGTSQSVSRAAFQLESHWSSISVGPMY